MQYSVCKKFDIDQMCHLRKSVGWNELKAMMSNPQMENLFSIICTENGKMIGFLNVVSNNVTMLTFRMLWLHLNSREKA